jgi:hypothetical protein
MIIHHTGKLSIKQIEDISYEGGSLISDIRYIQLQRDTGYIHTSPSIYGWQIAHKFGKPNCNMKGYESYPGAWVFYDTERNVRWLVFSDGIRKHHFKGTSYEVTLPEDMSKEQLQKAVQKFFTHFEYQSPV